VVALNDCTSASTVSHFDFSQNNQKCLLAYSRKIAHSAKNSEYSTCMLEKCKWVAVPGGFAKKNSI
jgi:hypothetical protein